MANEIELLAIGALGTSPWLVELYQTVRERVSPSVKKHAAEVLRSDRVLPGEHT